MGKNKPIEGFMCGIDFQHELGEASGGNVVYPSLKDAETNLPCHKSCGVVKVKVELVEWVKEQDLFNRKDNISAEEYEKTRDKRILEHNIAKLKDLEQQIESTKQKIKEYKKKCSKTKSGAKNLSKPLHLDLIPMSNKWKLRK